MIKIPKLNNVKKRIGFDIWYIGCYNDNDKSYSYTINNFKKEYSIKAIKLIKKINKNGWKVYKHFVTRAVDPCQYLQLIARDKVKRKYFYNSPDEADESVCHSFFYNIVLNVDRIKIACFALYLVSTVIFIM